MKLLGIDTNAKTVKGEKLGYMTGILYLAPADLSGYEVCAMRSAGCTKACLYTAGRGAFGNVQAARIAKTKMYFEEREKFMLLIAKEIAALIRKAEKANMIPVIRLNGTSDIPWERVPVGEYPNIMAMFPDVQFYDYTKRANRKDLPANYHLTFSLAEDNDVNAEKALAFGLNVAVVFRKELPSEYMGAPVVNGDETDLRFLDGRGVVVGLKAKGRAKKDTTGFVRMAA